MTVEHPGRRRNAIALVAVGLILAGFLPQAPASSPQTAVDATSPTLDAVPTTAPRAPPPLPAAGCIGASEPLPVDVQLGFHLDEAPVAFAPPGVPVVCGPFLVVAYADPTARDSRFELRILATDSGAHRLGISYKGFAFGLDIIASSGTVVSGRLSLDYDQDGASPCPADGGLDLAVEDGTGVLLGLWAADARNGLLTNGLFAVDTPLRVPVTKGENAGFGLTAADVCEGNVDMMVRVPAMGGVSGRVASTTFTLTGLPTQIRLVSQPLDGGGRRIHLSHNAPDIAGEVALDLASVAGSISFTNGPRWIDALVTRLNDGTVKDVKVLLAQIPDPGMHLDISLARAGEEPLDLDLTVERLTRFALDADLYGEETHLDLALGFHAQSGELAFRKANGQIGDTRFSGTLVASKLGSLRLAWHKISYPGIFKDGRASLTIEHDSPNMAITNAEVFNLGAQQAKHTLTLTRAFRHLDLVIESDPWNDLKELRVSASDPPIGGAMLGYRFDEARREGARVALDAERVTSISLKIGPASVVEYDVAFANGAGVLRDFSLLLPDLTGAGSGLGLAAVRGKIEGGEIDNTAALNPLQGWVSFRINFFLPVVKTVEVRIDRDAASPQDFVVRAVANGIVLGGGNIRGDGCLSIGSHDVCGQTGTCTDLSFVRVYGGPHYSGGCRGFRDHDADFSGDLFDNRTGLDDAASSLRLRSGVAAVFSRDRDPCCPSQWIPYSQDARTLGGLDNTFSAVRMAWICGDASPVRFYEEPGFGGTCYSPIAKGTGNDQQTDWGAIDAIYKFPSGVPLANAISSVRLAPGYEIRLCSETAYRGSCIVFTGDRESLASLDNAVDSFRVVKTCAGENAILRVYRHADYGGGCLPFDSTELDIRDYSFLDGSAMHDQISSIRAAPGWSLRVYPDAYLGGSPLQIVGSAPGLAQLNDQISSWFLERDA